MDLPEKKANGQGSKYGQIKLKTYRLLEGESDSRFGKALNIFFIVLIVLNVMSVALETVDRFQIEYGWFFGAFQVFSLTVFSIEYLVRLWSCNINDKYQAPLKGRLRYMITPLAIVDLIAILPFFLPMLFPDMRFVRVIRFVRFFRLFKLVRYSAAMKTLANAIVAKKEHLLITFFTAFIILVLSAVLIFFAEHDAQPDVFSDIPSSMWWAVVTLTTVGYGDTYPITGLGKILGSIIAMLGIGLLALPAGILASGFSEQIRQNKEEKEKTFCPHCGEPIDS